MNKLSRILALLLGLSIGVIIFQSCPTDNIKIEKQFIHDTIPGDSIPIWRYYGEMPKPDTVWMDGEIITLPPDSLCMAEWLKLQSEYRMWKVYNDTLIDDSTLLAGVVDTIHNNKLWGRAFFYQNRKPTIINTTINTTTINNADGIYAGGGFLGNSFGGEISVVKNKFQFDLGTYQKEIKVSVKYRIWKL